tara:strand:+ start:3297 stop:3860 length:564 start_codon:yes stop_codon:yes gene_type:complete
MREVDDVRLTLLGMVDMLSNQALPQAIIDRLLKGFLEGKRAAIRIQRFGRGTLERFRYHKLGYKDFRLQMANWHDWWRIDGPKTAPYAQWFGADGYVTVGGKIVEMMGMHRHTRANSFVDHWDEIRDDNQGILDIMTSRAYRHSRRQVNGTLAAVTTFPEHVQRAWTELTRRRMEWYASTHLPLLGP